MSEKIYIESPENLKESDIMDLIQAVEGAVIQSFSENKTLSEITLSFEEIENIDAKGEDLTEEKIKAIVKFLEEKKYIIKINKKTKEFKIKMPKELSENGY
jgi:hypothetical protein